jgi:hypothetical protein
MLRLCSNKTAFIISSNYEFPYEIFSQHCPLDYFTDAVVSIFRTNEKTKNHDESQDAGNHPTTTTCGGTSGISDVSAADFCHISAGDFPDVSAADFSHTDRYH